jgi:protein-S-isoprenylcysteine O-methyltransferase Ste14
MDPLEASSGCGPGALAAYFLFFALAHSLLADVRAKELARRAFPGAHRWYRLSFVLLAVISTVPFLYILAFLPGRSLYVVPWPWSLLLRTAQALAAIGAALAIVQTGLLSFLGLAHLISGKHAGRLVTGGLYCHVRNPLFLFGALFLWLFPAMTSSLIVFNLMATAYFYLGALHEERALLKEFGPAYQEYKKRVPMFIPRWRCSRASLAP